MSMKLIADIHTHTIASGHAFGTMREMAQAAAQKKLSILGISEHAPGIPGTVHPIYFKNLRVAPKELFGVRILHGSEINVLDGGKLSLGKSITNHLDYAIAGIHSLCYQDQGREGNSRSIISCMEEDSKVRFISHPDDDRTPLDYELLVKGARDNNVALEVNNSSLLSINIRVNADRNYAVMLEYCEKYRVPVIVNTDAHDPNAVGNFDAAVSLITSLGFDQELILNTSEDKLLSFILG